MGAAERAGDPVEGLDQVRLIRRRCQRRPPLARVSTRDQPLDRQTRALTDTGCIRVFADKKSGRTADRVELHNCLDYLRAGDTLVVLSLDRLSRSLHDLITLIAELRRRGIGFKSLHEAPDTTTPGGRLVSRDLLARPDNTVISNRQTPRRVPQHHHLQVPPRTQTRTSSR